ncbi:hypothetical protein DBA29_26320 [Xenophilus aerolatus]|nr:hypothetical protein [Xenophilus aerolatus]
MYLLTVLLLGVAAAAFMMWSRSPMEDVNAEMAERVETTRATLEEVPEPHPLLPRWRPRGPG